MNERSSLMSTATRLKSSKFYLAFVPAVILSVAFATETQPANRLRPQSAQGKAATTAATYTCPMDPEVKSPKPGKCPKCGMALRLAPVDAVPSANSERAAKNDVTEQKATISGTGTTKKMVIPDVEVLDQDGRIIHFYTDLVKGKTVAINFIFTNCTTICPPLAATFARLQKELGHKAGTDVHFISISVDPVTDTPERLKSWGAKFKAGAGWTFVTGDKQEIDKLLKALGASVARREDHSPTMIVGNDVKGVWTRAYGLANTSQLIGLILNVLDGKTDEATTQEDDKP